MKINIYLLIFIVYFFFNSILLPLGLLFTTLLTPLFYLWLKLQTNARIILKYLLILIPFVFAHISGGVVIKDYIISFILLFTVYIATYTAYYFLKTRDYLSDIFRRVTKINLFLTLIAVLTLYTPYKDMWAWHAISANISQLPRLQLFSYEPSHYSTLLVPVLFYFLLNFIFQREWKYMRYLFMLVISLILSFSLGVIASVLVAALIVTAFNVHKIVLRKSYFYAIVYVCLLLLITALIFLIIYPTNPLYLRIYNVFTGSDTSGRGRTYEAIEIALLILEEHNRWWFGIGLGQIKTAGYEIIMNYYQYPRDIIKSVAIPNSFAETLAIFGISGALIRVMAQIFLFFKTKVYNNYYQSLCFSFIFIYQFTGSYITNLAEYMVWLLAFIPYFTQFDKLKPIRALHP